MAPVQIFEGTREVDPVGERNLAQHRLSVLVAAVREHEARARRRDCELRPQDQTLYRRVRQIYGDR